MHDRLLVLNKDSDTMSVIDAETGDTETVVETEFNPHEIAVTPNGTKAYVTCSLGETLLAFDTETWERTAELTHEGFDFPHGLAIRERAGELWLASTGSSRVYVIDVETDEILTDFPTHQAKSHMVALTPDEGRAFVANIGSGNVTAIDCEERRILADPEVGEEPEGIEVHPEAGLLVANQEDGMLSVLDPDTFEKTGRALLGETPIRVVSSPDGRHVLVPNRESNDVSLIDTRHRRDGERQPWEIARIPVGIWPGGTVFDPDGECAFVANNKTNDVSVIDCETWTETERYGTELHPDGIAYLER
ncbi:40-residue YVTN family beta-propeller repeat-containing protein [Halobiforma haloterrestris]|uniref:40-residue YVTN family beta-propeller repeat-containing protein n=1 Tax=Natronobacterium haloterrestre TaxID=148448 RepID=A0A1I1IHI5_NATHA|nr:YncE family protein [Halobiforma haloterrestris]SFC35112.1 40-residue YVTN family beta-propeller repeat-containing protein [Halobiforma haloterrestris]